MGVITGGCSSNFSVTSRSGTKVLPMIDDLPPVIGDLLPMIGDLLPVIDDLPPVIDDLLPVIADLLAMIGDLPPTIGTVSRYGGAKRANSSKMGGFWESDLPSRLPLTLNLAVELEHEFLNHG